MERRNWIPLLLTIPLTLSGCAGKASPHLLPETIDTVEVSYFHALEQTSWMLDPSEITALEDWLDGLSLQHREFAAGESPTDAEGGAAWQITINGGEASFDCIDAGELYILTNGEWYEITNQS